MLWHVSSIKWRRHAQDKQLCSVSEASWRRHFDDLRVSSLQVSFLSARSGHRNSGVAAKWVEDCCAACRRARLIRMHEAGQDPVEANEVCS